MYCTIVSYPSCYFHSISMIPTGNETGTPLRPLDIKEETFHHEVLSIPTSVSVQGFM